MSAPYSHPAPGSWSGHRASKRRRRRSSRTASGTWALNGATEETRSPSAFAAPDCAEAMGIAHRRRPASPVAHFSILSVIDSAPLLVVIDPIIEVHHRPTLTL